MNISEYMAHDAVALSKLIKKKEVSALELTDAAFSRLEEVNPELNAVIRTRKEKVLQEIGGIDIERQPFAGVPFVLKDISQAVKGEPLTAGAKLLQTYIPKQDSNWVARMREAGFLFIGHTNTPEYGLKNISEPELYGPTKNPWNKAYSAGGSSGGSAAAVAAGIVPVAGASDGGGSIRIPASFTGLFGLKPTRGRTPVGPGTGRQWQGASIDFVLSRTVRDSAALLDILQVIQPEAAFQTPLFPGRYVEDMKEGMNRCLKIAFSVESPVGTPVSDEAKHAVHKTVKWLEAQGHHIEEQTHDVDGLRLMENYYLMNCGEISAMIAGMEKTLGRPITAEDVEIVTWVLNEAGKKVTAAEFTASLASWDKAAAQMAAFHKTFDMYVTPAAAFQAPKIGELTHTQKEAEELMKVSGMEKDEQQALVYDMFLKSLTYTPFTQLANLTGQPAMSVPVHLTKDGLPLGVQFTAPKGKEHWLLRMAYSLEQSDLWVGMKGNPMLASEGSM
ncbi:amidase [Bacillus sonorensis]|mgnify:CR=1 FL=1|uniref:Amidase n=2 Tax=Bacillus sonorensis TaxID=119858 RepID=M5PCB7_9BACI|nr:MULTISPECIES: amidase [Bacillus]TWK73892.1 6-aminohexanoate-cyclic-dimer hydrolase [Bacillus paralicheniformis]ASB91197.1 6-aminohexanoate-cyclic-dimer hydrolase [Bacillus sonorensis]EME72762.1 amidase [Bacillus sonorensis L12]MCZ0074129.1 amidase [Bacillus sonorensis]MCZ0092751.1 amidase [Bacillus sonorensis]